MHNPPSAAAPSPLSVALRSCCPRCGQGRLFDGFLKLAPRCNVCGLDYSFADPADGPAFFVMLIMAWPVTAFGVWIELAYNPPLWVHLVTTLPFLLVVCILPLRFFKGWLVASQYHHKAGEGQFEAPNSRPEVRSLKASGPSDVLARSNNAMPIEPHALSEGKCYATLHGDIRKIVKIAGNNVTYVSGAPGSGREQASEGQATIVSIVTFAAEVDRVVDFD